MFIVFKKNNFIVIYGSLMDFGDIITGIITLAIIGGIAGLVYYLTLPPPPQGISSIVVQVKGLPYSESYNDKVLTSLDLYEGLDKISADYSDEAAWIDKKNYSHTFTLTEKSIITKIKLEVNAFRPELVQGLSIKMYLIGHTKTGSEISSSYTLQAGELMIIYPEIWKPDVAYAKATKYITVSQSTIAGSAVAATELKMLCYNNLDATEAPVFAAVPADITEFKVANGNIYMSTLITPIEIHRIISVCKKDNVSAAPVTVSLWDTNKKLVEKFTVDNSMAVLTSSVNSPSKGYPVLPAVLKLENSSTITLATTIVPKSQTTASFDIFATSSAPHVGWVAFKTTTPATAISAVPAFTKATLYDLNGKIVKTSPDTSATGTVELTIS
jgi:hypothetical protein